MATTPSTSSDVGNELAGKYLTFRIGEEEYGLAILKVREIIELMDITPVPRTPESIRGVINLRGRIIPVLHIRVKFNMDLVPDTDETCIIVVESSHGEDTTQMAILVDGVREVLDIAASDIEPAPSFGESVDNKFILAMAKSRGTVKILLNIEEILNSDELLAISRASDSDQVAV